METMDRVNDDKKNICYWQYSYKPLKFEKLNNDETADVVVVGDGLAAISVAFGLVGNGRKVILLSEKAIGTDGAGRTNSHLLTAIDNRYHKLERIFGQETARLVAESHRKAIDHVERTSVELNIDCEFERLDGFLFLHPSAESTLLGKELRAARNAGVSVTDLPFVLGTNKHVPCLKFHDQAQFHPMKYIDGLCRSFLQAGGRIYTGCGIASISEDGVLTRSGHKVSGSYIVDAGDYSKSGMPVKQYRTYTIAARIKKNSVRKYLWWDTGDKKKDKHYSPYHYVRLQRFDNDHDLLICGGQSHFSQKDEAIDPDCYVLLESWMRERFPVLDIIYKWSSVGNEPANHIGYIGRHPESRKIYVVNGDSGHGAMTATIAGMLIPDLIDGKPNAWAKIYDPSSTVPSRLSVAVKGIFRDTLGYFKKGVGFIETVTSVSGTKTETTDSTAIEPKRDVYTEGLHAEGNIFWNNDEESWDRIRQKGTIVYNRK